MTTTFARPSPRLARMIEALRADFSGYAAGQEKLLSKRSDLAPAFYKAFEEWKRETRPGLISFVRELDPSVPADKKAYQHHRAWVAAWYLYRSAKTQTKGGRPAKRNTMTPFELLATFIKSTLPVLPNHARTWELIAKTSKWHERDLKRLRNAVADAKVIPLLPHVPRHVSHRRTSGALALADDRG
jgi:hypothetical protein